VKSRVYASEEAVLFPVESKPSKAPESCVFGPMRLKKPLQGIDKRWLKFRKPIL
jgi:hypothetical protein